MTSASDGSPNGGRESKDYRALALKVAREHRVLLVVLGIMAAAFAVRLYYLSLHTAYTADSYYFLLLARSIRDTLTYSVRGVAHTKYLPGYPGAIWLGGYLLGGLERSANLIAVLGGTFTVLATYGLGRELFNKWVGLVACFIVAFQPTFLKWTSLPMTEGLFTFLFAGGIYMVLTGCKRASPPRRVLGVVAGGLCFLVRWEGILFLPLMALVVLLYVKGSKLKVWEPFVMLAVFGLPMSIYVARNLIVTGKITSYVGEYRDYSTGITFQVLKHRVKVYGWNGMSDAAFSAFFYLGSLWCLVRRRYKEFGIVAGWFALFLFMHLFWYYAYERFMAPAVPAVALMTAFLLVDLATGARKFFAEDGWVSRKLSGKSLEGRLLSRPESSMKEPSARGSARAGKHAALLSSARVLSYMALAMVLIALVTHGVVRANTVLEENYKAFADDHGGAGMKQAADWIEANAPGQPVAVDAGPYFNWLYYPGEVLYMRPVPWDLPVEDGDVTYTGALQQLYGRGVRYLVIGQTEKGADDELKVFGIVGGQQQRLRRVARWVNHYEFPEPHDLETVIFEVLPPPRRKIL